MNRSEKEWQVLRDVTKPPIERTLPPPGASPVWDYYYNKLSADKLIKWVQADPFASSMCKDHYVFIGSWDKLIGG